MINLRKQLTVAAASTWAFWIVAALFGWGGWSTYPNEFAMFQFALAALVQASLWIGVVSFAGALFTHILIVRDNELYEAAADDTCGDACCAAEDQSNSSS